MDSSLLAVSCGVTGDEQDGTCLLCRSSSWDRRQPYSVDQQQCGDLQMAKINTTRFIHIITATDQGGKICIHEQSCGNAPS